MSHPNGTLDHSVSCWYLLALECGSSVRHGVCSNPRPLLHKTASISHEMPVVSPGRGVLRVLMRKQSISCSRVLRRSTRLSHRGPSRNAVADQSKDGRRCNAHDLSDLLPTN